MPAFEATKLAVLIGLTAKLEASYGAGGALSTATDGVLLSELADLNESFEHDGKREPPASTMGTQRRVPPKGDFLEFVAKTAPRGLAAAYGASALHPEHVLMRMSGHDAVITSTAGVEKIVYTPSPGPVGFASAVLGGYSRGSLWSLLAAYADWTWGAEGAVVPMSEWAIKCLFASVADAAVPAITYPAVNVDPPVADNILFSIGGVATLSVKKFQFKQGRNIGNRRNMNAQGGHGGFFSGRRNPTFTVTIEEPMTATYDARTKRRTAVCEALSLQVGTVQYNRDKFTAPQAQLVDTKPSTDGDVATLDLTYELQPSVFGANDEYSRTVD
jgi:hypothetical protein